MNNDVDVPDKKSDVFIDRLERVTRLKDYAISNNLDVNDDTLRDINKLQVLNKFKQTEDDLFRLDRCIRDLTEITYPTTIETVSGNGGGFSGKGSKFLWILAFIGLTMLAGSIFCFSSLQEPSSPKYYVSVLAVCLGTLGALIYIFFNLIGVLSEKAFSVDDIYSNTLRLVIGAIIGWIFFFAFVPDLASKAKEGNIMSLLPFLGGFSTRLVVGIITQAISAVELTLGLEDKSTELLKRKVKGLRKEKSQSREMTESSSLK